MVEAGNAIAVMGNHEFNGLAYHSQNDKNGFLREHNEMHTHQPVQLLHNFIFTRRIGKSFYYG